MAKEPLAFSMAPNSIQFNSNGACESPVIGEEIRSANVVWH